MSVTRPPTPARAIAAALSTFLRRGKITRVYFAENAATTPQPLAYFVHFPRLYVALSGRDEMWFEQDGEARLIKLRRGHAVVVPANCWNRPASRSSSLTLNLLFGRKQAGLSLVAQEPERGHCEAIKTSLHGAQEAAPRSIMQALLTVRTDCPRAAPALVEGLLRAAIETLTKPPPTHRRKAATLHESICMYVQEHFQSALTRESVAAHFRISPNHVSRLFNGEGQVSFNAYVGYVRINWAKYLLKTHRQSVDEVAAMCGFSEASYFCRVFKAKTGFTPSDYRQSVA